MKTGQSLKAFALLLLSSVGIAQEYGHLEAYEPVYFGYTQDDDDVPYLEFQLSLKYPILHSGKPQPASMGFLPVPYLKFTGRFAMYMHTRDSSPVLAKRYNPELSARYWLDSESGESNSLDILIGHESNGQSIGSYDLYLEQQQFLIDEGEDAKYADDYISRGWDYAGLLWTQHWAYSSNQDQLSTFVKIHDYLKNGIVQVHPEEYNTWENDPEGKPRNWVDGITVAVKKSVSLGHSLISAEKFYFSYTTGIKKTFDYHSYRAEFSLTLGNLPIMLWTSYGYNSDFADYYKQSRSTGLALVFTDF